LLLGADAVTLYREATAADAHGWALADLSAPVWTGAGSFQRSPGRTDARADQGGGHGPYDPRSGALALLYLPPDAPVADGLIAEVGGQTFALSQTRPVHDPRGTGDLDCWVAVATGTGGWPT
jgi:hypothetical protein